MGHGRATRGQGVGRKEPFSPPLHSWYLIGLVPASPQGPFSEFLLEGAGRGSEHVPWQQGQNRGQLEEPMGD